MSKSIIMRRNSGDEETLNHIEKIQADGYFGSWVPEDETSITGEITINVPGKYPAYRDGVYGYTKATVDIQFPISGVTLNGVGYTVSIDDAGQPHITVEVKNG